jgi:outer membrane protein assembly factor BamB
MRRAALVLVHCLATATAAAVAAPPEARGQTTSYQAGPAHAGFVREPGLTPPLRRAWTHRLPGSMSHPLIAGGRVFITADLPHGEGRAVHALSARSGRTLWRRPDTAQLAYDQGRLFAVRLAEFGELEHTLLALAPATGRVLWQRTVGLYAGPPVASGGVVVLPDRGLHAFRAADGALLWHAPEAEAESLPAVAGGVVYASSGCGQSAVARDTGQLLWHTPHECTSAGVGIPVFHSGRLYVREGYPPPGDVYDAATGRRLRAMPSDYAPAFSGGLGLFTDGRVPREYVVFGHTLTARSLPEGRTRWRFRGDGYLDTEPLIVNGTVYVGSGSGRLYGLSLRSGRIAWRTRLPRPVLGSLMGGLGGGLAAGEGLLVVPSFGRLVAFR